jgi:predicted DsbA family dithiol-disulfide isomerase
MQAGGPTSFVEKNNKYLSNTYRACLAFHASSMQGKNKGHEFLTLLQEQVVEEDVEYSDALVEEIAYYAGLDVEMFLEDYESELTKKFYKKNLQLASEMDVAGTPSCVIYKNDDSVEAIRLNDEIENELLHAICGLDEMSVPKEEVLNPEAERKLNNIFSLEFSR